MEGDWLGIDPWNRGTGPFSSPLDNDPLVNIGNRGINADPETDPPPTPTNFKAKILYPGPVIELSCQGTPYGNRNYGLISRQKMRFWITPMRIEQLMGGITSDQYKALFARAEVIDTVLAPRNGSIVTVDIDFQTVGIGIFWATQFTLGKGSLESAPAGPAYPMPSDYQDALDKIPPAVCTIVSTSITTIPGPLYSDLKYVRVSVTFHPPANTSHFHGVIPLWKDYFVNNIVVGSTIQYGGFIPWDGKDPSTVTWDMEADYNSTGTGFFLTSHTVTLYLLSVNNSWLYQTPYTGQLAISYTPGIGN